MRTPTLPELRRVLGQALLAAPLLLACRSPESPHVKTGSDAQVTAHAAPDAAAAKPPAPVDAAAAAATGKCLHDPPDITGCGGAEVALHSSLADCGLPAEGDLSQHQCDELCKGFDTRGCRMYHDRSGAPEVFCDAANPCMGRMASTGDLDGARYADATIDHLALARRMEAHSVAAFRELEADLARWGAPASILRACRRAAADEARHAHAIARLLRARGVEPERLERTATGGFASLGALALHNEREGAVGETWGALVAMHQAAHAIDPDVRDAMRAIADEETAHAALSFEIGAWARTQLEADDVRALDDERRGAFARLRATLGARPDAEAADRLGWPSAPATGAMLDALAPLLAA